MSSRARKRQEKAQDRAFAIMERTEKKVELSKESSRNIQSRAKIWDAVNQEIPLIKAQGSGKMPGDEDESSEESELDDEMGEVEQEGGAAKVVSQTSAVEATTTAMIQEDDDGIL